MKVLKVNESNYRLFDYPKYINRNGDETEKPNKLTYDVGDVVFVKPQNSIGVVIGCIEEGNDLRTDVDGMQCFSEIRHAKKQDFKRKGCFFSQKLYNELFNNG